MPRYFKSTANKPGGGVRKGYRRGGRNLRDEEARVIGVQDNAADELRRVRARRPHDAAERRDRRDQLARVGSRERNARDEMDRLRGYQYGGAIGRQAAAMGPAIAAGIPHGDDPGQRYRSLRHYLGNRRGVRGMQYGGAIGRQAAAMGPSIAARANNPDYRSLRHYLGATRGYQYGGAIGRQAAAMGPSIAAGIPHGDDPSQDYRSLRHYLGNRRARGYQAGGRVGFKTGGRIPRKKKGAKFI